MPPRLLISARAALLAALLAATPATARLETAGADGFISTNEAVVPVLPATAWAALVAWARWWDPAHSYSRQPGAMVLTPEAGAALLERWPGVSVRHAVVLAAMPGSLLRLSGGFGPLQALPVNAILEFTLKPEGGATRLAMTYRVAGPGQHLDQLAAPVDAVMSAGFARLTAFASQGKP